MKKKLLIIGIDSASFRFLSPMMEAGLLPNIAHLVKNGASGPLKSSIPPVTPPAWVSFMTGKNPGKHGVFDFYGPPSYGYERPILNSKYIKAKTLWRILSEYGYKLGIINLPITYPPEPINGFMIPGMQYSFDGNENFSYPPELLSEINQRIGEYRVLYGDMVSNFTDNKDMLLKEWREIFEIRKKTFLYLMENKEWDVFVPVFFSIDVMQHNFFKFFDKSHPLHDPRSSKKYKNVIFEFYEKIDSAIGEIVARAPENTPVLILSDHGSGPEKKSFYINRWLHQEGFLSLKKNIAPLWRYRFPHFVYKSLKRLKFRGIEWTVPLSNLSDLGRAVDPREGLNIPYFIDWNQTKAYAGNYSEQGIYLNLKGREHHGIIEEGSDYERIRDEIILRLRQLKDPQSVAPLKLEIYKKEEVYNGPFIKDAPDIFVIMNDLNHVLQKEIHKKEIFGLPYRTSGTHRLEGILIASGEGIRKDIPIKGATIVDVAPTILYLLGLPVPEDMDGKPLLDIFAEDFIQNHQLTYSAVSEDRIEEGGVFDEKESQKIKEYLRDLGYI